MSQPVGLPLSSYSQPRSAISDLIVVDAPVADRSCDAVLAAAVEPTINVNNAAQYIASDDGIYRIDITGGSLEILQDTGIIDGIAIQLPVATATLSHFHASAGGVDLGYYLQPSEAGTLVWIAGTLEAHAPLSIEYD